jgi:hypothetical protein
MLNRESAIVVATVAFSAVWQSAPLLAQCSNRSIAGDWEFVSNDTPGTLTIEQHRGGGERCKQITGTLDAFEANPIVGLYCADDAHIIFGRLHDDVPFQMYDGHVSSCGNLMAGNFFYWGNEGPARQPTSPFVGKR